MSNIPTQEPASFEAGVTVKWTKDLSDCYPADQGWALSYTFISTTFKFTVTASADGTQFLVNIAAGTTAGYTAGIYKWIARVEKSGEVYTVDSRHCEILKNIAAMTNYDHRTHVKKVLDAIEAVIEKRATKDQMGYTIDGQTLEKTPIPDLLMLRDKYMVEYQRELDAEKIANGQATGKRILTRF